MTSERLAPFAHPPLFPAAAKMTALGQAQSPKARAAEMLAAKNAEARDWAEARLEAHLQPSQGLLHKLFGKADSRTANAQKISYQEVVTQLETVWRKRLDNESLSLDKLAARKLEVAADEESYWSPESTAERIYTVATGYFDVFKGQQKPSDLSENEALDRFLSIMAPALDTGFDKAAATFKGFNVFSEAIASNAQRTQELVHEKLQGFRERVLQTTS